VTEYEALQDLRTFIEYATTEQAQSGIDYEMLKEISNRPLNEWTKQDNLFYGGAFILQGLLEDGA
jgi:hypothetical protein